LPYFLAALTKKYLSLRLINVSYFAFVSPPYLKKSDYINLSSSIKIYEPKNALVSDSKDGTMFYNHIISSYKNNLKLNGYLAFEIGDNQFKKLQKLLSQNGFIIVSKFKLINDQIRCLLAKKIKNYALQ